MIVKLIGHFIIYLMRIATTFRVVKYDNDKIIHLCFQHTECMARKMLKTSEIDVKKLILSSASCVFC